MKYEVQQFLKTTVGVCPFEWGGPAIRTLPGTCMDQNWTSYLFLFNCAIITPFKPSTICRLEFISYSLVPLFSWGLTMIISIPAEKLKLNLGSSHCLSTNNKYRIYWMKYNFKFSTYKFFVLIFKRKSIAWQTFKPMSLTSHANEPPLHHPNQVWYPG